MKTRVHQPTFLVMAVCLVVLAGVSQAQQMTAVNATAAPPSAATTYEDFTKLISPPASIWEPPWCVISPTTPIRACRRSGLSNRRNTLSIREAFRYPPGMCIAFRFQLTLVVGHAGAMLAEKRGEQPQRARQLRRKRGSHLRTRLCFAHDEE